jgi:type II secretory pathway component PulC
MKCRGLRDRAYQSDPGNTSPEHLKRKSVDFPLEFPDAKRQKTTEADSAEIATPLASIPVVDDAQIWGSLVSAYASNSDEEV